MDKALLDPLSKLETSLNLLLQSLITTNTFSAAPKAAKDLVAADDELTSALITLKRHQDNFTEILRLRTEAETLNNSIKDTVRTCVALRNEIGDVHPSILEDSDDEDEEAQKHNPIDYETLLAFASRIGRHNAIARKEAEKEAERADIEVRRKRDEQKEKEGDKEKAQPTMNGAHAQDMAVPASVPASAEASLPRGDENGDGANTNAPHNNLRTEQAEKVLREMRHLQKVRHHDITAPFPHVQLLRLGELGRIHYIREENGEQAAEDEVERMVKRAEIKGYEEEPVTQKASPEVRRAGPSAPRPVYEEQRQPPPSRPQKAFDVDFPGGDDDDDDDDDD
ncbi:hypothetical protein H2198_006118 [Neophaeococcomyces mojaviensis]|uniref:Uncharacterized protein n=1 Tax=Neophaeococcomyces mojaviensis TaxID=3383035 RepID=A0ACC3A4C3_9EURO|nr:hypothetical protein H2198_006118 [Knufia sp. JES_112]